jgi:glycosyltransferase involved in cell wall biosynthesis
MSMDVKITVSIIIKTLNEEQHIAACLTAAVREAETVGGEVVLVDSLSTDRTLAIAKQFPIRIVQFQHKQDCGCGAATQLGYQSALGDFIYVLDGDMVLQPGFLALALKTLQADASLAGVGGKLMDNQIRTVADQNRSTRIASVQENQYVKDLGGGGLYRRAAIESAGGYLAHRGLVSLEESELGARLVAAGWRLLRLTDVSVVHTGHAESNWQMLRRLWRARRPHAIGVTLRAAVGKKWCRRICKTQWFVFTTIALHALVLLATWILSQYGLSAIFTFIGLQFMVWLSIFVFMVLHKGGLAIAGLSIFLWHYNSVAAILGFCQAVPDPLMPIPANTLQ